MAPGKIDERETGPRGIADNLMRICKTTGQRLPSSVHGFKDAR